MKIYKYKRAKNFYLLSLKFKFPDFSFFFFHSTRVELLDNISSLTHTYERECSRALLSMRNSKGRGEKRCKKTVGKGGEGGEKRRIGTTIS